AYQVNPAESPGRQLQSTNPPGCRKGANMKEDRERESEFERRIREQTAYRDAKREARLLKAGEFEGHPWVKSALESKDRASRPPRPGEDSNTAQHGGRRGRLAKSNLLWACAALLPVL